MAAKTERLRELRLGKEAADREVTGPATEAQTKSEAAPSPPLLGPARSRSVQQLSRGDIAGATRCRYRHDIVEKERCGGKRVSKRARKGAPQVEQSSVYK